jgi:hypothetical protein
MRTLDIQYKARRCCHMIERDLFETQKVNGAVSTPERLQALNA